MTLEIEIDRSRAEGAVVVILSGELDLAGCDRAGAAIREAEEGPPRVVAIDLRELVFIDSSGVRVLIEAHDRAAAAGHRLIVTRGTGEVARAAELLGLDGLLDFVDDLDLALPTAVSEA
jgi:anti-anti-sigma factor